MQLWHTGWIAMCRLLLHSDRNIPTLSMKIWLFLRSESAYVSDSNAWTFHIMLINFLVWTLECTDVRFASYFSGGFITATAVNQPDRRLAKRTSVQCAETPTFHLFFLWKLEKTPSKMGYFSKIEEFFSIAKNSPICMES